VTIKVDFQHDKDYNAVTIGDKIKFGENSNVNATFSISVHDQNTTSDKVVLRFSANPIAYGYLTMKDLIFYPNITDTCVNNFRVDYTSMSMYNHTYDPLINALFAAEIKDFNAKWKDGWALANLDPMIGFLTGWFKNTTLQEGVADHYAYLGWSMQQDVPPMEDHQLDFIY